MMHQDAQGVNVEILDYPAGLKLPETAEKNMTSDTGFLTQIPARGTPVFQKLTDDLKYRWSVRWVFESSGASSDESRFKLWLSNKNYLDNGNKWFRLPIYIGGAGLQPQVVHFESMPVQTTTGPVSVWTGSIIARELYNPYDEYADLIIEFPQPWWDWLDICVNRIMPEFIE